MSAIAPPSVVVPTVPETRPTPSTSSLGGAKAIQDRFKAFQKGEAPPAEPKVEAPNAEPKAEPKVEVKTEPKAEPKVEAPKVEPKTSILPPEVTLPNKDEPKVEPKVEAPKGPDGLTKEERAELVAHKEAVSKERDELKTKLAALEEEKKRLEAKAIAFDVRASKEFSESIEKPFQMAEKAMTDMLVAAKLEPAEVFAAIFSPNEGEGNVKLSEYMSTLDTFTQGKFQRTVDVLRDLDRKAAHMAAHSQDAWNAIQVAEKQRSEAAKAKEAETTALAHEAVYGEMSNRFPFLKDSPDFLTKSKSVEFDKLSPDAKAYYVQAGQAALLFNPVLQAAKDEIESLRAALKKHQSHGPADSTPSTESGSQPSPEEKAMEGMTIGQRMVAQMAALRGQG